MVLLCSDLLLYSVKIVEAIDERSDGFNIRPVDKTLPYIERRYTRLREDFRQVLQAVEATRQDIWKTLITNLCNVRPHIIPPLLPTELFPIGDVLGITIDS